MNIYLSGECIECLATSDDVVQAGLVIIEVKNVVQAGLTPKHSVQTLCSMLTFKQVMTGRSVCFIGNTSLLSFGNLAVHFGELIKPYVTRYLLPFD